MPIPIPIPMPVASQGRLPHDSQQQQQRHSEGEVKKIYLLQPMPRLQHSVQTKGSGFSSFPQINNYQQPTPIQQQQQQQQLPPVSHKFKPANRPVTNSYGDPGISQLEETPLERSHSSKSGGSDLKILPIVVIPPIAPMPPIQLPQAADSHKGRISFSPRFNNYFVNGADEQQNHSGLKHQDQATFSEYGGSLGGSVFRGNSKSPRHGQRQAQPVPEYGQSNWSKLKVHSEHMEDRDGPFGRGLNKRTSSGRKYSSSQHPHQMHRHPRPGPVAQPRMYSARSQLVSRAQPSNRYRNQRMLTNSIRNAMDGVSFDDELDHEDFREALPSTRTEYYNSVDGRMSSAHSLDSSEFESESTSDSSPPSVDHYSRDTESASDGASSDRESSSDQSHTNYVMRDRSKAQEPMASLIDEVQPISEIRQQTSRRRLDDLSALYYKPDLTYDSSIQVSSEQKSHGSGSRFGMQSDRDDNYSNSGEEEWRFDTIKSVVHASPAVNKTVDGAASNGTTNATLSSKT